MTGKVPLAFGYIFAFLYVNACVGQFLSPKYLPKRKRRKSSGNELSTISAIFGKARGFTLLELLVVIVIIGLLASYVGPRYFSQLGRSETTTAKAQMQAFARALGHYRIDVGRYPNTEQGLNALLTRPGNEPKWNGPYLQNVVPPDPWGKPYIYRSPGEKEEFEIVSYGKNGAPGGTGDNADILVH